MSERHAILRVRHTFKMRRLQVVRVQRLTAWQSN
jgi:hypothetical protein